MENKMGKGHNFYGGLSAEHLRQFIERLERLDEEKKNISADMKEVFSEAKGHGFDVKTIRQILKIRKTEANELEEQEYLLDTYKRALGMMPDLFDEDDNPAINENEGMADNVRIKIQTPAGEVETDLETLDRIVSRSLKSLKAIKDIKAYGDNVRKLAKEHAIGDNEVHSLFVAKATELKNGFNLPYNEILAVLEGDNNA